MQEPNHGRAYPLSPSRNFGASTDGSACYDWDKGLLAHPFRVADDYEMVVRTYPFFFFFFFFFFFSFFFLSSISLPLFCTLFLLHHFTARKEDIDILNLLF
jgi:hypothetical protein